MTRLHASSTIVESSTGIRRTVRTHIGIRYAALRDGRRFDPPRAVDLQDQADEQANFEHTSEVPIFPQLPSRLAAHMGTPAGTYPHSDDAFFLNISAPTNTQNAPVVLFVHGGAWISGAGTYQWYSGESLAAEGVCVVSVNYRLHAAGILNPSPEHLPLQDLTCAIHWVHLHIEAFGGDPENITLVGQSAGGWYVHALAQQQNLAGKFRRIALLSMATRTPWPAGLHEEIRDRTAASLGVSDLRDVPARKFMVTALAESVRTRDKHFGDPCLGYAPTALLPKISDNLPVDFLDPEASAARLIVDEVFLRYTSDETAIFFADSPAEREATHEQADKVVAAVLEQTDQTRLPEHLRSRMVDRSLSGYERICTASSWLQFQQLPHQLAAAYRMAGKRVELHEFTFRSPDPRLKSCHCFDLPFLFNNRPTWKDAPYLQGIGDREFAQIARASINQLLRFITT
ncbi:alpha/beta fold hydrolase [Micrococcoides hystricis]|uniref:Carboxylic ester hydrolase n=1 Tax=Micrococcoides hystricis TaxID=1572761 RepID=A0ABV6PAP8_9MICC